jgi:hypothetical protein
MNSVRILSAAFAAGLLILSSCSSDVSPTGPSSLSTSSEKAATAVANSAGSWALAEEEFNCTNVREVHVRFSDPGFSEDNVVGLFVSYAGVPDTKMTLRVWWDYEGAPDEYEDVPFDDDDVLRDGDFVNIEKVIEHTYLDVNASTTRKVRVELLLADQTGNCARVREVALNPPATSGGRAGFPPAAGTNGNAGVLSGNVWTVCRANSNTAWVASTGGGQYNAVVACQSLGYSGVNAWGGNCGTVCGYCGTPNETYDGNGGPTPPTDLGFTVHWRCN